MKKFPHQQFIEDNNLDIQTLPEMLQKRIKGFDELEEDLQHTTDEDKEQLISKLETLSSELEEDLEEHFEEQLENNDQEEDELPEVVMEPIPEVVEAPESVVEKIIPEAAEEIMEELVPEPEAIVEETISEATAEVAEEPAPEPEIQEEAVEPDPEPEPVLEPTDEEILEGLLNSKKSHILPAELKEKGFKTSLNERRLLVGKFCLHRGKYDTCYKIILKSE
jgi:hypothetical protein